MVLPRPIGAPLELRIGVNSGLVVAGTVGDGSQTGVMGDPVNVAARIQQAAGPGQVLVSEAVWRRVRDRFEAEPLGALAVKGREGTVATFRVGGRRAAAPQRASPFVGRGDELGLLELLWSSTRKGNTHVVSVVGEAGVGKSRLLAELPAREDALDLRITCGAERTFGPFLDLVGRILSGMPADPGDLAAWARAEGVEEGTARLIAPFLGLGGGAPVVWMGDEQRRRQMFAGVGDFLRSAFRGRPAFVVLDDVHFADRSSLDLLAFLLERLAGVPLLLVLSYRPGFDEVDRVAMRASHTAIRLEPLGPGESVALARGYLGVQALPADLERLVVERAEGNPFFIEELLRALIEVGSLVVEDGRAVLVGGAAEVPDTIQGTILARVDRLGPAGRAVLQRASVLGRAFDEDLLAAIGGPEVNGGLEDLARAQLVVIEGLRRWAFRHGLIRRSCTAPSCSGTGGSCTGRSPRSSSGGPERTRRSWRPSRSTGPGRRSGRRPAGRRWPRRTWPGSGWDSWRPPLGTRPPSGCGVRATSGDVSSS